MESHVQAATSVGDPHEDCDFSNATLSYISQILMEEEMGDMTSMLQDSLVLQAAEKSFYDVLGVKYPHSAEQLPTYVNQNSENPDDYLSRNLSNCISNDYLVDPSSSINLADCDTSQVKNHSSISSSNSVSPLLVADLCSGDQPIWQFRKGVEEVCKFLPSGNGLFTNFEVSALSPQEPKGAYLPTGSRGRKNPHREDVDLEAERSSKQAVVYPESTVRSEMFDAVLLNSLGQGEADMVAYRYASRETSKKVQQKGQSKESAMWLGMFDTVSLYSMGKGESVLAARGEALKNRASKTRPRNGQQYKFTSGMEACSEGLKNGIFNAMQMSGQSEGPINGKKDSRKKKVVDLRILLFHCAQAVGADDRRSASELLKQIRRHSSPFGDGNQRLAHCFADGLEARLAGTGSQIYKAFVTKRRSAADYLKAYRLFRASCPFSEISDFVSNKTIMEKVENAMRLHIIDFGILYGFQWPAFIQRISAREGGPPKIRITGIEFPQPGFRPAAGVEETGRRLADYARSFNVPFEYNAIAMKWESIKLEDLKIDEDEILVVNCLYRAENLHDETLLVDSPRHIILDLIRRINPDLFIHGIVNAAYSAPFFVTRFQEALFHFSTLFDILETNIPREDCERMFIEKEIFGKEALNVIACEGWERVERPETYKQWQVRVLRAGFMQLPFDREIINRTTEKVRTSYHKDFVIDEDSQWLLQGWKGRIIYALSCWKPV